MRLDAKNTLPADGTIGALAARAWRPDVDGPSIVALRGQDVIDITRVFPTMRDLCETPDPATALQLARGERLGSITELLDNTPPDARNPTRPWLLAPIDLQVIKAAGVRPE